MKTETPKTPLISFRGDPAIKEKYLARVHAHREADQIIQGRYWAKDRDGQFRGCAVGCTLHSGKHSEYETELGIPVELAHLEDSIFENLPIKEAREWPEQFLNSIPVGADLSKVWMEFIVYLLVDEKDGVIRLSKEDDVKAAVQGVAACYIREIAGEIVPKADWQKAGEEAWEAWVAWEARVARVAREAREAWVAWEAWEAWEARVGYVRASAKKLLALLAVAETPRGLPAAKVSAKENS